MSFTKSEKVKLGHAFHLDLIIILNKCMYVPHTRFNVKN